MSLVKSHIQDLNSPTGEYKSTQKSILDGLLVLHTFMRQSQDSSIEKEIQQQKSAPPVLDSLLISKSQTDQELRVSGPFQSDFDKKLISVPLDIEEKFKNRNRAKPFVADKKSRDQKGRLRNVGELVTQRILGGLKKLRKDSNFDTSFDYDELMLDSNFLFNVEDSERLYSLGHSFFKKYKSGIKNFSFSHFGADNSQKKSILGIASYIKYFENLNIAIVTSQMDRSIYGKIKQDSIPVRKVLTKMNPKISYEVIEHQGIDFIEVEMLASLFKERKIKGREIFLTDFFNSYDVVLYDLPTIEGRKKFYEIYFAIFQLVENVTLTITLQKNTFRQIDHIGKYFKKYNIGIDGCIIEGESKLRGVYDT